ncbi:MAG: HyaD/HybD family hydrogenase maturation endopeptidase [Candidatus Azobacteroides sp.]|nr:HyaD/HybD family hydrogenase maturation endopeptidase [Candidatus Azobacteroides sp.]
MKSLLILFCNDFIAEFISQQSYCRIFKLPNVFVKKIIILLLSSENPNETINFVLLNSNSMKTLILGVGNLLLKDEGVGIHAIRALENETLPPDVSLIDGGTGGLHLISWLQGYDRIIMIDATLDDNPPGTIRLIQPRYASDFPHLMSAHEIGLRDMIEAMSLTGSLPEICLIVISAADISEVGTDLSPEIQAVIPEIVHLVKNQL